MPTDLARKNLARVEATLTRLQNNNSFYVYDDLCLCHFLRTMLIRMILQEQGPDAALKQAHQVSVQAVLDHADKVQLDHYTYYFTIYEKARMLIMDQQLEAAQKEINYLIRCSEKNDFNVGAGARAKNKYSLENSLILKCHNCLEMITEMQQTGLQQNVKQLALDASSTTPVNQNDDSDDDFQDAKEE